jgi:TRAP-type mannitol/chloroaromatic compound transport system permease small subunit
VPDEENVSLIARLLSFIDWISRILAYMTMVMMGMLILVMSYEMVARRLLNAPTLWAFDISYMLSGVIFVASMAFTLQRNEHIRIDFLSTRLPIRLQHAVNLVFYVTLFLPAMYILSAAAVREAWDAFMTGQLERVSPWSPLIWPYYSGLAIGLCALTLQVIAEVIRHAINMFSPRPAAELETPVPGVPALAGKDF